MNEEYVIWFALIVWLCGAVTIYILMRPEIVRWKNGCKSRSREATELKLAIVRYYKILMEVNENTGMMISSAYHEQQEFHDKGARLMQEMYQAQSDLFRLANFDYHGGTITGKRDNP